MESYPIPLITPDAANVNDKLTSCFKTTVTLHDWWLIKVKSESNRKTLAVGGIPPCLLSSKGVLSPMLAPRVFSSAPIVKRLDTFTLETADEVSIIIHGFINKTRTLGNGFSPEIFNHFVFGFPPNWEECGIRCYLMEVHNDVISTGGKTQLGAEKLAKSSKTKSLENKGSASPMVGEDVCTDAIGGKTQPCDAECEENMKTETLEIKVEEDVSTAAIVGTGVISKGPEFQPGVSTRAKNRKTKALGIEGSLNPKIEEVDSPAAVPGTGTGVISKGEEHIFTLPNVANRPNQKNSKAIKIKESSGTPNLKNNMHALSPKSLSRGKSRSGRLLIPPMEFWRNQLPIYDSDRHLTAIQDGPSLKKLSRGLRRSAKVELA